MPTVEPKLAVGKQALLSTFSSLIIIVDNGDPKAAQFSHFSDNEYLTSDRQADLFIVNEDVSRYHIFFEPAHTILAQACLGVLLRLESLDDRVDGGNVDLSSKGANDRQTERRVRRSRVL